MTDTDEDIYEKDWKLIGFVLTQFNQIELLATEIISLYISPQASAVQFLDKKLLNNSIVSFGSKIKLLLSIAESCNYKGLDRDKLHRMLALRNAIAHNDQNYKFHIPEDPEEDCQQYFVVEYFKSNGSVEEITKSKVYSEILSLHQDLEKSLRELRLHV